MIKDDRHTRLNKENAYAKSILYNAIRIGGKSEALRARSDLYSILKVSMSNVTVFDQIENYAQSILKTNSNESFADNYIKKIFVGVSDAVLDTLIVMANNGDMRLVLGIYDAYNKLFEETYNQVIVDVTTAVELDDNLRKLIKNKAQNDLDSDVVLAEKVDKKILGGIRLQARNRTIDSSLFSLLNQVRNELTSIHQNG